MPLDYQQILTQMNQPRRRQGSSFGKIALKLIIFAVIVVAGYAVWHFGYIDTGRQVIGTAWNEYAPSWLGGGDNGTPGESIPGVQFADLDAIQDNAPANASAADTAGGLSLAIPPVREAITIPAPAPIGSLSIEAESSRARNSATPGLAEATARQAAPVAAPVVQQNQPRNVNTAPVSQQAAVQTGVSNPMATPVLSDARAQLKNIDSLLRSDPSEALRKLETLVATVRLQPDEAADAGYRMGYAARLLKDEARAEKAWTETAKAYPAIVGGRFSALAIADTWYLHFAGSRPQVSRWDDIQEMYSIALGQDDAPFLTGDIKARIKANLTTLNDSLFFGSAPCKMARYHKVEQGELLGSIASKYRVDYESMARINGVNPNRIRAGMDLKVIVGEVSIVVRKNEKDPTVGPTVTWFLDGRWVREYPACVGDGIKTPAGTYQLTSKERDPSWTNPLNGQLLANDHPDNILGSRWMAMKGMNTQGLGIHGTTVDDSIPGYTSAGCVRLHNLDVEEMFSFARIGNKVTILD